VRHQPSSALKKAYARWARARTSSFYYGTDKAGGWQSLDKPLRTITTLDRFGVIQWKGKKPTAASARDQDAAWACRNASSSMLIARPRSISASWPWN
jgi:hypothetical protein